MNELKIKQAQQKSLRRAKAEVARLNDELNAARFWHDVAEAGIIEPERIKQARRKKCRTGALVCFVVAGIAAVILIFGLFGCNTVDGMRRDVHQWTDNPAHHQER